MMSRRIAKRTCTTTMKLAVMIAISMLVLAGCISNGSSGGSGGPLKDASNSDGLDGDSLDSASPTDSDRQDVPSPPDSDHEDGSSDASEDVANDASGSDADAHEGSEWTAHCRPTCTTAADCAQGSGAYDEDNWGCAGGACIYTGCISDQQCLDSFAYGYICSAHPDRSGEPAQCVPACDSDSDCGDPQAGGVWDQDNYTCNDGGCFHRGCNDDQECAESMGAGFVCAKEHGVETPRMDGCVLGCTSPTDCTRFSAGEAYTENNYECSNGACRYLGCNNDAECENTQGDHNLCR